MRRAGRRVLVPYVLAAWAVFLPKIFWPRSFFYTHVITPRVERLLGSSAMLAPLAVGAAFSIGAARRLEPGNPARPAWMLLSGWLTCFAVGEAILVFYEQVLGKSPPIPSIGDAFFLLGYAMLFVGAVAFIRVYLGSGLPLGPPREPLVLALASIALFAILGTLWLRPIAHAPRPLAETVITLAYPILDFAVLVPTVVLVRITRRFQGGRVWTVWGSILAGFAILSAADILFAYFDLMGLAWLDPLLDVTFIAGYALTAFGAAVQYELVGT